MLSELLPAFVVTPDSQSYDPPICCQNGADTTLGEIRDDGLYLCVLPIDEIFR